jgi:hypothetical protein
MSAIRSLRVRPDRFERDPVASLDADAPSRRGSSLPTVEL